MTVAESNIKRKLDNIKNNPLDLRYTPKNLYLWGYLWADGYLNPKQNRVALEILTKDFNCIADIVPSHFNYYTRQRPERQNQSAIITTREDYYQFLKSLGYENKNLCPNNRLLTDELSYYWFRGLVDGDGSWYVKNKVKQFCLSRPYNQDWSYFTSLLDSLGISKYSVSRKQQKSGKFSTVRFTSKDSLSKFINYLYPEQNLDIGLSRKYDKAMQILSLCK